VQTDRHVQQLFAFTRCLSRVGRRPLSSLPSPRSYSEVFFPELCVDLFAFPPLVSPLAHGEGKCFFKWDGRGLSCLLDLDGHLWSVTRCRASVFCWSLPFCLSYPPLLSPPLSAPPRRSFLSGGGFLFAPFLLCFHVEGLV